MNNIAQQHSDSNRRIAKNTVILYIRMLLSMIVSLYTSRVVLNVLGVDDYGIYTLVAGFITIFGFLNATMSGSTSRFITFELGRKNTLRLKNTFSTAMLIHLGIGLLILILGETAGLWFVNNKLVIPADRLIAANWIYQFSIVATIVSIIQVPYNASIIAHERMNVYAYVEILNVILKLLIVYILYISPVDKLILYGFLSLCVSIVINLVYRFYCTKHFEECRFHVVWDKSILKPMLSFSGWDLYGHMGYSIRQQGVNVVLNIFFGTVLNAAAGIATQVQGVISSFSTNIITAFRPQIIKSYACNDLEYMQKLIRISSKYAGLLMIFIIIPVISEMDFLLGLWLKEVPPYSVIFCQVALLSGLVSSISQITYIGIQSTGKVKQSSIIRGTLYCLVPIVVFILFKSGMAAIWSYILILLSQIILSGTDLLLLKRNIPIFSIRAYLKYVIIPCVAITIILFFITYGVKTVIHIPWLRLIISFLAAFLIVGGYTYFSLDRNTRQELMGKIKHKLHR